MIDLGTKRLETDRLILRRFELSDVDELFYSRIYNGRKND